MDVFDLVAKIRLDKSEYESGLGEAKGGFANLASGVGKGLATVAKVGAAAVSAGVAGVAALTKMGVEGYAQYEQLVGGVETLFKSSQSTVMAYAENAYKTAGMSANQYMETVTSFSASLIQSLDGDTAKAAQVADMAITDMSDNANKMGTSIEMIQNAYNGFAKGNFTMLDNLKLGYGGTKTEMERLLQDAEKISGIKYDISSFADVTEAIHVMQEEMGIAGTTASEAATTIEGSLSMMKASWENLVVGMADSNADMDVLINNFVESAGTAAQNLLPRIEQTLIGIGSLIEKLAPVISAALPSVIENVLPSLLTAGVSLVTALVNGMTEAAPALLQAALDAIETILVDGFGVSVESASGFVNGLEKAIQAVSDVIGFAIDNIETITGVLAAIGGVIGVVTTAIGLYNAVQAVKAAMDAAEVTTLGALIAAKYADAAATLAALAPYIAIVAAIAAVIAVIVLCVKHWDEITAKVGEVWEFVKTETAAAVSSLVEWFTNLGGKIGEAWENIKTTIADAVARAYESVSGFIGNMITAGAELIDALKQGAAEKFMEFVTAISEWITSNIVTPIVSFAATFVENGRQLIEALKNGAYEGFLSILAAVSGWVTENIITPIMSFIGQFGQNGLELITSFKDGAYSGFLAILAAVGGWVMDNIITPIMSYIETFGQSGKDLIESLKNGAHDGFIAILSIIGSWINDNIISPIVGFAGTFTAKGKELIVKLKNGAADGFGEILSAVGGWVTDNIVTPITNMGSSLYDAGVDLLDNFWDGLSEAWGKILEWWNGLSFPDKKKPELTEDEGTQAKTGLNYIPYDGFRAILHRGEAVLTSAEASVWRKNGLQPAMAGGGGVTINQYIQTVPQTPVEFANATEAYFEQARWML